MALMPCEYEEITYLQSENSIPASNTGYQTVTSLLLTKGKWLVTCVYMLPTQNISYTIQTRWYDGNAAKNFIFSTTANGNPYGANVSEIVDIKDSTPDKHYYAMAYAVSSYTGNFTARLAAIKLED